VAGSDKSIEVSFGKTNGIELRMSVSGISDLSGKIMSPETRTFSYSFSPEVGSILINEILFNPFSGGVDFVELVNVSERTIPVHRLKLASRNDTLALKQIYAISTDERYLYPEQFLVCMKDATIVAAQYFTNDPETFCTMKTLPSFSDDAGTVVLLNDSLEVLDEFNYSAKMHSPFLADKNGVSLERISLDKPTSDRKNWASAVASVGFATPGLPNSQTASGTEIQDEITPEPKAFSPNGDGYNDELAIKYSFSKPGYMANVRIFDIAGRQVKFLVKNQSLAQEGNWLWNGESESGQKLSIGVYIILVEVFDQEGNTNVFKKTCTITDRVN
ncbi:MAG: gliding motility-associated C-terminal domain-containing protein, partial [Bacteroidota bacterium]|nr:gliding motility-associated C-terminal domain-containing protein [Bacteroidota bacterium]